MQPLYKRILNHPNFLYRISLLTPVDFLDEVIPRYAMYYRRLRLLKSGSKPIVTEEISAGGRYDNLKAAKRIRSILIESLLMFFLYQECKLTQNCLAQLFGGRHRSTVRRRLRTVVGIEYLISTRTEPDGRLPPKPNSENIFERLVRDFPASEKKLVAKLRTRRTTARHPTIRTPEEFFALYPQLAGEPSTGKTISDPFVKSLDDIRRSKTNKTDKDSVRLKVPPRLTPECYKNAGKALTYLIEKRWAGKIKCATCGGEKIYNLKVKTSPKQFVTGSVRFKCAQCRRKFTVITGTKLSDCRLKPDQILKAVFYVAVRPRKEEYTLEKFASEIGITAKTAAHFVNLLRRNLDGRGEVSESMPSAAKPGLINSDRKSRKSFLKLRNSISGSADEIIEVLLEPVAGVPGLNLPIRTGNCTGSR